MVNRLYKRLVAQASLIRWHVSAKCMLSLVHNSREMC